MIKVSFLCCCIVFIYLHTFFALMSNNCLLVCKIWPSLYYRKKLKRSGISRGVQEKLLWNFHKSWFLTLPFILALTWHWNFQNRRVSHNFAEFPGTIALLYPLPFVIDDSSWKAQLKAYCCPNPSRGGGGGHESAIAPISMDGVKASKDKVTNL